MASQGSLAQGQEKNSMTQDPKGGHMAMASETVRRSWVLPLSCTDQRERPGLCVPALPGGLLDCFYTWRRRSAFSYVR